MGATCLADCHSSHSSQPGTGQLYSTPPATSRSLAAAERCCGAGAGVACCSSLPAARAGCWPSSGVAVGGIRAAAGLPATGGLAAGAAALALAGAPGHTGPAELAPLGGLLSPPAPPPSGGNSASIHSALPGVVLCAVAPRHQPRPQCRMKPKVRRNRC